MDRAQSAETLQKFFENLFQDGIFQNYENCCQVSPGSGMNVLVNVGGGCCGGSIFVEENIRTLALQAAHESLDRIDAIIVRKNNNINYRSTDLYVVTGNPAEIPVAPEPTRSSSIHEIVLAHVFVARGTTSIPSYRITDTRLDSSVCGIATPMQEVDTSGIFAQYQSALDEYLETVASAIDNTLAGNLQNQITALSNNQADAFSKTSTYSVGDYCIYQNVLKKCIKDVETAGDYDSTCWEDTTIGEEFSELNRNLIQSGTELVPNANGYFAIKNITFPVPYAEIPNVTATVSNGDNNDSLEANIFSQVGRVSKTGCVLKVCCWNEKLAGSKFKVSWIAVGRRSV